MADKKISELSEVLAAGVTSPSTAKMPIERAGEVTTNYITASQLGTLLGQHAAVTATNASITLSGQAVSVALDGGANNLLSLAGGGLRVDIPNTHVTYAKIQNVSATDRILGRVTAGAGTVEEITCGAFGRSLIDDADATAGRTTLGLGSLATQSGTFSGTSSGTNTGDQTITLTGDVTGSGTGSFAATIAADAVTYAKMQDVSATSRLLGRATAGAGIVEEITIGANLSLSGTTLNAAGGLADGTYNQIVVSGSGTAMALVSTATPTIQTLALATQSLTGTQATSLLDLATTWNTTGTPSAIKLNVTDTASNAASKLIDLQVGGAAKYSVFKDGSTRVYASATDYTEVIGLAMRCYLNSLGFIFELNGNQPVSNGAALKLGASGIVSWQSTNRTDSGTSDTVLLRDGAAGALSQRATTTAQSYRVYNTWTSSTNYERGVIDWQTTANTLRIGTEKGSGGGTARALALVTDGTARQTISSTGQVTFAGDNVIVATAKTPASATATGTTGMVCWDSGFIYVCTATDTWKRAAIATW